jgi:hypothetical protein
VEVVIEENEESLDGSIDSEKVRFLIWNTVNSPFTELSGDRSDSGEFGE